MTATARLAERGRTRCCRAPMRARRLPVDVPATGAAVLLELVHGPHGEHGDSHPGEGEQGSPDFIIEVGWVVMVDRAPRSAWASAREAVGRGCSSADGPPSRHDGLRRDPAARPVARWRVIRHASPALHLPRASQALRPCPSSARRTGLAIRGRFAHAISCFHATSKHQRTRKRQSWPCRRDDRNDRDPALSPTRRRGRCRRTADGAAFRSTQPSRWTRVYCRVCPKGVTPRARSGPEITAPSRAEEACRGPASLTSGTGTSGAEARTPTVASMQRRAPVGRLLGRSLSTSELAQSHATAPLLRLAERPRARRAAASRAHRLAICRDDAVVGRARHDRWMSSDCRSRDGAVVSGGRARRLTRCGAYCSSRGAAFRLTLTQAKRRPGGEQSRDDGRRPERAGHRPVTGLPSWQTERSRVVGERHQRGRKRAQVAVMVARTLWSTVNSDLTLIWDGSTLSGVAVSRTVGPTEWAVELHVE